MARLKGSSCLLSLQRFCNILLLVVSLAFIGAGVYMMIQIKSISVFPMIFVVIGVLEILLAFLAICNTTSKRVLSFYYYTLLALVGLQVVSTGMCFAFQSKIAQWAADNQTNDQQAAAQLQTLIEQNLNYALYIAVAASVVQVFCLIVNICYKRSLKKVLTPYEKRLMADSYYSNPDEKFNERRERDLIEKRKEKVKAEYRANQLNYKDMMS